jgi:hypothetical protein
MIGGINQTGKNVSWYNWLKFRVVLGMTVLFCNAGLKAQYVDLTWDLVAHYSLDGHAEDISGYANHGSAYGATFTADRHGVANRACFFDGIDDYINCGRKLEPIRSELTVSCWVHAGNNGGEGHIVSSYDFTADAGFILGIQDGLVRWAGRIGSGAFIRLNSYTRIDDGRWHHLLGVVDGENWSLFVDGRLENRMETGFSATNLDCTAPLTLGMHFYGDNGDHRYFKGILDDVLIYRRVLNPCEIEILTSGNLFLER